MPDSSDIDPSRLPELVDSLPGIDALREIAGTLPAYLVGGVVRDLLLGRPVEDFDLAVEADADALSGIPGFEPERESMFLTGRLSVGDETVDIAGTRAERYPGPGALPEVRSASIEEDLARRDFTINAMAVRLPDGAFTDPFGGVRALADRVLDTPLDPEVSFSDDPLRMVRAARFVAQLDVRPTRRLTQAIAAMRSRLGIVAPERLRVELDKLVVAPQASDGLALLVSTTTS